MRFVGLFVSLVLAALAFTFLAGALVIAYRVVICGINEPSITVAALLATVAGLFLTSQRQLAEQQEKTSRFYLEQYQSGFDRAYEILDSATPGEGMLRRKWVAAARVLATARQLLDRVSVSAHRDVARMTVPHQSQRFQRFFEMPGWYYYGTVPLPRETGDQALDDAAKLSTQSSGTTVSALKSVPEKVICAVWQAVAYPKDYKDVLGERFSEGDRLFSPEGLQTYLNHREQWHSVAGRLHKRSPGEPLD